MTTVTGKSSGKIDELLDRLIVSVQLDPSGQLVANTRGGTQLSVGSIASSIVSAAINTANHLILTNRQGGTIDVGPVGSKPIDSWPVGSLFFSGVTTDPAVLLGGGTWARYGQGRTMVSVDTTDPDFDAVGDTGGEKTHTLSTAEMPAHDHADPSRSTATDGSPTVGLPVTALYAGRVQVTGASDKRTGATGGGAPHNNMPPYIAVYVWKRTA